MIVKLKTDAMYENFWEFISDITSFRYTKITNEQAVEHRKKGGLNDYHDSPKGESFIYFQGWHQRSSDPINIITNSKIYLLTDEGKTIERIN